MRYCLDTNIISYLFDEDSKYELLREKFEEIQNSNKHEISTSIIVLGEIFQGLKIFEIEFASFEKDIAHRKTQIEKKYRSDRYNIQEFLKLEESEFLKLEEDSSEQKFKHLLNLDLIKRTNTFFQEIKTYGIDYHVVTMYVENYYLQKDRRINFKNLSKKNLKTEIQKSYHDLWIAATCMANNLILVTNNEDDFNFIPTLNIENWTLT